MFLENMFHLVVYINQHQWNWLLFDIESINYWYFYQILQFWTKVSRKKKQATVTNKWHIDKIINLLHNFFHNNDETMNIILRNEIWKTFYTNVEKSETNFLKQCKSVQI